jgi:hypothetical protein
MCYVFWYLPESEGCGVRSKNGIDFVTLGFMSGVSLNTGN